MTPILNFYCYEMQPILLLVLIIRNIYTCIMCKSSPFTVQTTQRFINNLSIIPVRENESRNVYP